MVINTALMHSSQKCLMRIYKSHIDEYIYIAARTPHFSGIAPATVFVMQCSSCGCVLCQVRAQASMYHDVQTVQRNALGASATTRDASQHKPLHCCVTKKQTLAHCCICNRRQHQFGSDTCNYCAQPGQSDLLTQLIAGNTSN